MSHRILLGAQIDDFVIACVDRLVLQDFRKRLLEAFDGTCEGPLEHYLRCEIARDLVAGNTQLSQMHYAEQDLRTCGSLGTRHLSISTLNNLPI